MVDDGRMAKRRIRASDRGGEIAAQFRKALHMGFIDQRVGPRAGRRAVLAPACCIVDDDAFWNHRRAVAPVHGEVAAKCAEAISEQGVMPAYATKELACIRIDKKLVRVEPMPLLWLIRSMHAIAV